MAVNITQNGDTTAAFPSGTTAFASNVNAKVPLVLDDASGAFFNYKSYIQFYDDFLGDVIDDAWSAAEGNDAQAIIATINAQAGGVVRLVTGDTAVVAESAQSLTHGLNWKANQGGLYLAARIKLVTSVADVCVNVGFTDTLATTTLEEPITISGTTITTNATDAVVFVYDTAQTNDNWHCQGVKADADTAIANTGVGVTADAWVLLEIKIDTAGTAEFYIDGQLKHTAANAVTVTTSLTPVVTAMARTTASKTLDVDYIFVAAQRA